MAPITIKHIVSFSSQDPKHPAENLLSESSLLPWLVSSRERSGCLRVELQLEKASHIAYIDIGNCGSALVQIDVGRSSWPLDRPFVTLLPTTTLMSPADSKQSRNPNGVRMFKKGDFLADVRAELWDRVRISASQPFNKRQLFGLSFIRFRSALDEEQQDNEEQRHKSEDSPKNKTLGSQTPRHTESPPEAEGQKSKDQLPPSIISPRVAPPNSLSRTARMVLTAAKSRKRRFPDTTPPVLPPLHMLGEKSSGFSPPPTPPQEEPRKPHGRRRLRMEPPPGRVRGPVLERQAAELGGSNPGIQRAAEKQHDCSNCPICGGYFQLHYLPFHAATCGEEPPARVITVSSSDDSSDDDVNINFIVPEQPDSRVSCPICGFYFPSSEIQIHANTCGE